MLVLRDTASGPEVFMVRRHHGNEFMAGAYVFPGGRVEEGDRGVAAESWCDGMAEAVSRVPGDDPDTAAAFVVAAARELFEEAGVLVARDRRGQLVPLGDPDTHARFTAFRADVHAGARTFPDVLRAEGLRLALDAIVPFAHWVTPPADVRRFDTRFFLAPMPPDQRPAHDELETTEGRWLRPAEAIGRAMRGEIALPPPTWTSLRELEPLPSAAAALAWAARRPVVRREPKVAVVDGESMVLLPGDPLFPDGWLEAPPRETRFLKRGATWWAIDKGSEGS